MPSPQFSVRTLLVVFGLLSICFALLAARAYAVVIAAVIVFALIAVRHGIVRRRIHFVMLGTITALLAGALLLYDLSTGVYRNGYMTLNCDVVVLDATSGAPIAGAKISPGKEFSTPLPGDLVATDAKGRSNVLIGISIGGYESGLGITHPASSAVHLRGHLLHFDAPGYAPATIVLTDITGRSTWPDTQLSLPPINVKLMPKIE